MLRNNIVIAVHLLLRNKVYSIINILGLSVGIACCILISCIFTMNFVMRRVSSTINGFSGINTTVVSDGVTDKFPRTTPPMAFGLAESLPEVEVATRIMRPPGVEQNISDIEITFSLRRMSCLLIRHFSGYLTTCF